MILELTRRMRPVLLKIAGPRGHRLMRRVKFRLFNRYKAEDEFSYWRATFERGTVRNDEIEWAFMEHFELPMTFFKGKRILDIGCGPRGSLEWAKNAAERVGLDPLVVQYRQLGIENHEMTYVDAPAEAIPYPDEYFDVVSSFNSLDHVDDLDRSISEIKRVLKPDGYFLLMTHLNHERTVAEPQEFSWEIVQRFKPELSICDERHYELTDGTYGSIKKGFRFDHTDHRKRDGILSVKFLKERSNGQGCRSK